MLPASTRLLGPAAPLLHGLMLALGLGAFGLILWRRLSLLRAAAPDPRLDSVGARLRSLLVVGLGQSRQMRYPWAGVLHILIFAGFLILLLRSASLLAAGFRPGLADLGPGYAALKDWTELVVLACCVAAALRRLAFAPRRYRDRVRPRGHAAEPYAILALIAGLMMADAAYEGSGLSLAGASTAGLPLASAAAAALRPLGPEGLASVRAAGFWSHNALLLFFLCYLPFSKHFHVLTALPNVFFAKLPPAGRVKPPRHGRTGLDGLDADAVGVGRLEDFTWKHILDFYSCTDCGRCSDHCPAYATGTALSPRAISVACRDAAYAQTAGLLRRPGSRAGAARQPLVGGTVSEEAVWACTTCGACEEACPVLIEYVDKIVDLRRRLVDGARVPAGLAPPLGALAQHGNPYGKMARRRAEWLSALSGDGGVRLLPPGDSAEALYFTDSATAFDPRLQRTARAFGALLRVAGVDAGTLGADEVDSGHEARRCGEEGLFLELRRRNLEALGRRRFESVVATDPHAYNALRHDYGLTQPVRHHSEVLAELLAAGRLPLRPQADALRYTFHDPCYLGRHNGVYEAPRRVLRALPGARVVEMERARSRSFCCGGGSLYLFREVKCERRMGEVRLEMAERAGAQVVVTACPFCLLNLEDALKTSGREERMEVLDLAELVQRFLDPAARPS